MFKEFMCRKQIVCAILCGCFLEIFPVECVYSEEPIVAQVESFQGIFELADTTVNGNEWRTPVVGSQLRRRSAVRTGENSRAGILFRNGVLVKLNELSALQLNETPSQSGPVDAVMVEKGDAYFFSRNTREFPEVSTPLVSAAIVGTEFLVSVASNEVTITVLHGEVRAHNQFGSVTLRDGEQAVTIVGQAPTKSINVVTKELVQWSIHYPAVVNIVDLPGVLDGMTLSEQSAYESLLRGDFPDVLSLVPSTTSRWQSSALRSIARYRNGDIQSSIDELRSIHTEGAMLLRASLFLACGQVAKAKWELDGVRSAGRVSEKGEQVLIALEGIVAVANNDQSNIRTLQAELEKRGASTVSANLTLSYLAQSQKDLNRALSASARAMQIAPADPAVIARYAELLLSTGKVREAEAILASSGEIDDSRVVTVKGFVALTANETMEAKELFLTALEQDNSSGIPYLGLGLATIKLGALTEGREMLEKAVLREPANSLLRSYLGKALFEDKEGVLSERELAIAKNLDSNDPTPYLYSAFTKLAAFRPIEALEELEESIKRNDNRAVYRSQLLLDQDLAVRGVGLSQVYSQLGFTEAARDEAIKSIQRDYSNYSAHLLLAGAYLDGGERFSLAGLSEFFVAQLLAPRDFVFFMNDASSSAGFNEYAALFDRKRIRTNITGGYSSSTRTSEGGFTSAGTFEDWSYIASYEPTYMRGYRSNDYDRDHGVFFRTQYQPTFDLSLSSSTIFFTNDQGDAEITFDRNGTDQDIRQTNHILIQQLGARYEFAPRFQLISQALYSQNAPLTRNNDIDRTFFATTSVGAEVLTGNFATVSTDRVDKKTIDTFRADSQIVHDTDQLSLVAGVGLNSTSVKFSDNGTVRASEPTFTAPLFGLDSELSTRQFLGRGYAYSTWHSTRWLDVTVGGSLAHLEFNNLFVPPYVESKRYVTRFDPKVALSVYLSDATTFRAAYFRSLGTINGSETGTIEPTLVGGFNQALNDVPGVQSDNIGASLIHKIASHTYVGTEFLHRELDRSVDISLDGVNLDISTFDLSTQRESRTLPFSASQNTVRSYLHQVISERVAATLKHSWSFFGDEVLDIPDVRRTEQDTHEIAMRGGYFHPSGITLRTEAAWRLQNLSQFDVQTDGVTNGTEDFWLLNAGISYQLKNRYGSLSFDVTNILSEDFNYLPTLLDTALYPERSYQIRYSLTF